MMNPQRRRSVSTHRLAGIVVGAVILAACAGGNDSAGTPDLAVDPSTDAPPASDAQQVESPSETTATTAATDAPPDASPVALLDPTSDDSDALFDQNALHTFDLTLSDESLATLDGDPTAEEYVEGTLGFQGETFGTVGVRHKGSIGSYIGCVDGPDPLNPSGVKTCTKISMKIKVNWDDSKTEFFGQRKLMFNSSNRDPSMMHERLGYWLFREMGIPASRSTHARVNLNGEFLGVFSLTEQVDGRFTRANFEEGKGNLYKEIWPFWSDFTVSPEDALREGLRTNEDDPETTTDVITTFASELLAADPADRVAVVDRWTDLDALITYSVVDRAIRHDDGPLHWYCNSEGCGNQNFYWYEEVDEDAGTQQMRLIPWDLDGAFGNITSPSEYTEIADGWGEITNDCQAFPFGDLDRLQRSGACDPLIGTLATLTVEYVARRAEFLAGPFSAERVDEQLDMWTAQIADAVAEAEVTHTDALPVVQWNAAIDELRRGLEISRNG